MSTDTLREEHETLQRVIKDARHRAGPTSDSAFVREMQAVMDDYSAARKDGLSADEAMKGIEAVLRERWPRSKFGPACGACDDTGWEEHVCTDRVRCGRKRCALDPAFEHRYVVPCGCAKGDRHAGRRLPTVVEGVVEATQQRRRRLPPSKGFARFGGGS